MRKFVCGYCTEAQRRLQAIQKESNQKMVEDQEEKEIEKRMLQMFHQKKKGFFRGATLLVLALILMFLALIFYRMGTS